MKKALLVLGSALMYAPRLAAQEWSGVQYQVIASFQQSVTSHIGITGSLMYFALPRDTITLYFAYLGPSVSWTAKDSSFTVWVAPQAGIVSGDWTEAPSDGWIPSLWAGGEIPRCKISLFAEAEYWQNAENKLYYGFYQLTRELGKNFSFGLHGEHAFEAFTWGPDASWRGQRGGVELQYHRGGNAQFLRTVLKLTL